MINTPEWEYLFKKYSLNGVSDVSGVSPSILLRIRSGAEPTNIQREKIRKVYEEEMTVMGQAEKIRSTIKNYDDEESWGGISLFGGKKGGAGGGSNNAGPISVSLDYF